MNYDVFNGDADGICALHQLRLHQPLDSELVTGVKRDIELLDKVKGESGDNVTVLDVSLDKNRLALEKLLESGVIVNYIDHHYAGEIPAHRNLKATIDTNPSVCTSLLVNTLLRDKFILWAVAAAFGDNLDESARAAARKLKLSENELDKLKTLGICINYNGYGSAVDDLFYHPADLYLKIKPYSNPFDFIENDGAFKTLSTGYNEDLMKAANLQPEFVDANVAIFILPDDKWARRVSGIYGNDLAQKHPARAHAVLTKVTENSYQVSVRAPLETKVGADTFCRQFETGGGRQAAAGINLLPVSELSKFVAKFAEHFARQH